MDCIFCRIARGELPANVVLETPDVLAFRDLHPQAPVHALVIPKHHVVSLADLDATHEGLAGALLIAAAQVAREAGLEPGGYRVVTNIGVDGGQSVSHLHLHVLGGRAMGWPPG